LMLLALCDEARLGARTTSFPFLDAATSPGRFFLIELSFFRREFAVDFAFALVGLHTIFPRCLNCEQRRFLIAVATGIPLFFLPRTKLKTRFTSPHQCERSPFRIVLGFAMAPPLPSLVVVSAWCNSTLPDYSMRLSPQVHCQHSAVCSFWRPSYRMMSLPRRCAAAVPLAPPFRDPSLFFFCPSLHQLRPFGTQSVLSTPKSSVGPFPRSAPDSSPAIRL